MGIKMCLKWKHFCRLRLLRHRHCWHELHFHQVIVKSHSSTHHLRKPKAGELHSPPSLTTEQISLVVRCVDLFITINGLRVEHAQQPPTNSLGSNQRAQGCEAAMHPGTCSSVLWFTIVLLSERDKPNKDHILISPKVIFTLGPLCRIQVVPNTYFTLPCIFCDRK